MKSLQDLQASASSSPPSNLVIAPSANSPPRPRSEPERQSAVEGKEPAERDRGRSQHVGAVLAGVNMIKVVARQVVMEGGGELEVEAPDAVIQGHSGIQGQREGVFLFHPGVFPIRPGNTPLRSSRRL